jgi:poly(3-hydroxybutyrate) depolymerase
LTSADYDAGDLAASENPMVRLLSRWLPLLAFLMMSGCTSLPDSARGRFEARAVKVDGETAYYQVFIPAGVQAAAPTFRSSCSCTAPASAAPMASSRPTPGWGLTCAHPDFPALVVFPQVPGHEEWSGRNNRAAVAALDATIAEFGADPARQYLTGMSMGGYGSWNIALDDPRRFAAIVPVCGAVLARARYARPCSSSRSRTKPIRTR